VRAQRLIASFCKYVYNKKWYASKGYVFTEMSDYFIAKISDVPTGSHINITVSCDECNTTKEMEYRTYLKRLNINKYYCSQCTKKIFSNKKMINTKLKNGKSFEQWCEENNKQEVLNRWDFELNNCNPSEVLYSTHEKYYFKCPDKIHESEKKNLHGFVGGQEGSMDCKACNSIGQWIIDCYGNNALEKYWSNKNTINPFEVSRGSNKNVLLICQICKREIEISPKNFFKKKSLCDKCSDGISYPEKFIRNILNQLNLEYICQLSKANFYWCNKYRYDFYIPRLSLIIETHGNQHFKNAGGSWKSVWYEQENDKLKWN